MSKDIRAFIPFTNVEDTSDNRLPMLHIPAKNLSPVSVTNFPASKWKRRQLAITYKGKSVIDQLLWWIMNHQPPFSLALKQLVNKMYTISRLQKILYIEA